MQRFRLGALLLAVLLLAACRTAPETDVETEAVLETTATVVLPSPDVSTAYPAAPPTAVATVIAAYPAATPTLAETAVPPTPTPETAVPPMPQPAGTPSNLYLPLIVEPAAPTPAPTITPSPTPTPIPTVDFAAVQSELRAAGQELSYAKIGFHVGTGGNTHGLEEWMRRLDAAGVPFFLKSVDNAQPLLFAQELMRQSGVPHTLVFRRASGGNDGYDWDVPNYDLPPAQAAAIHWQQHIAAFPPELDPSVIWLETINEVDKNRAEWLGQFALETAALAQRDGFKWAAFGWSSGEPETVQWETPSMLAFLQLAGANPDRLAIALHEYSYDENNIADGYPYKVGRFQYLLRVVDSNNIPRPTILITEWGWTYQEVPDPEQALADIAWASRLYARYPEIKGAAIWYLGGNFADIANQAQRLIEPVMVYTLQNYFARSGQPEPVVPEAFEP